MSESKANEEAPVVRAHVRSVGLLRVFAALIALTGVTVSLSFVDLGGASLPLALIIALIKAGLVVGYFMHLKGDVRFHQLVFLSALLFVAVFFALTFVDLGSRGDLVPEAGNAVLQDERRAVEMADRAREALRAGQLAIPTPAAAPASTPASTER